MALCSCSSVGLLCFATSLMVAIVSGTSPYYSRPLASVAGARSRGGSTFNRFYETQNAAAHSMQAGSCAVSGAHEVCHTADLESDFQVHICPTDGSPCDQNVCYYTSVPPCCPGITIGLECKSVTTLLVEGKTFNVTHYQIPLADNQICVSISPAVELCDEACRFTGPCPTIECPLNVDCDSNGENCQCREGFTEESGCCVCEDGYYQNGTSCIKFCRENCRTRAGLDENGQPIGGCTTCFNGYDPPTCCNCSSDRVEVDDRICKCRANLKPDGTCAEGALEPDCCECDTTGNATHAFYKNEDEECIPFCQSNCAAIGVRGCLSCKTGFEAVPECCRCEPGREEVNGICKCSANLRPDGSCIPEAKPEDCCECITGYQRNPTTGRCEPERCDKQQQLFFYIDATASNNFENFCPLMVVIQMLVAAFNPSSTSGTQIASLLFSDNAKNKPPSPVFDMNTPCSDAVQGSGRSLSSLMIDFGVCLDNGRTGYDSTLFPSSCGEGTSALKGLQEILRLASTSTRSSAEGAIVMLTDGIIIDDASKRTEVLNNLKSAGISTLIAAGINDADEANLRFYTSSDNILVGDDPVQLGIDIVNKMQERGIICQDHADNITRSLNESRGGDLIDLFCLCHRKEYITRPVCERKYPTCGGSLSFGLPNYSPSGRARTQNNDALEYINQLLIEEEILAAVEKVLEQRHHG